VLPRAHGGAIPVERIGFEPARDAVLIEEEERIAELALSEPLATHRSVRARLPLADIR
jgi:hypothetical protein